ncbi:MAG TPA: hypothetical protein VHP38_16680 [Ruminiclostridium sp.]|nr:hypothetical protein [Ruminiclostridium sp.]
MKIEAHFSNIKSAKEAAEKLKQSGFMDATVDVNQVNNNNRNLQTNITGTEPAASLSGLVLGETHRSDVSMDSSPLSAASPMVSGIGRYDEIASVKCKLAVEAAEADSEPIKRIISDMGGEF